MLSPGDLATFLAASAARAKSQLTPVTHKFLDGVAKDARAMIGTERAEWSPLAEATIAEKQRLGFTGQISPTDPLLRTGGLRDSIKADAEMTAGGVRGVVGSTDKTAVFQEMGTHEIPPRPFLSASMMRAKPKAEKVFGEFARSLLVPGVFR